MDTKADVIDLTALGAELLEQARDGSGGRASHVFRGKEGGRLNQVVMGIRAGHGLSQHHNPGEALLVTLTGRVVMRAGDTSWELGPQAHLVVPQEDHSVEALEDSVIMLTVVNS